MTTRQKNLLLLVIAVGLAVLGIVWSGPGSKGPRGILSAVPRDSYLVITLDLEALRGSSLAGPILGGASDTLGVDRAVELCGFDPLARVKEIAVALPEGGDAGDFGVVASGDLKLEEFEACARKIIGARGGDARLEKRGTFTLIEGSGLLSRLSPRIAMRDGGPFIIGRGVWLEEMLDAAEGKVPNVGSSTAHVALREALASRQKGRARALVATAVLPKPLRERLKREMGAEMPEGSNAAMAGVLGVEAAGLALAADGDTTDAVAELRCETEPSCVEVKKLLEKKKLELSQQLGVRLIGLGPVVDSFRVTSEARSVSASARGRTEDLARSIDQLLQLRRAEAPKAPPASSAPPDEVLKPKSAPETAGDGGPRDAAVEAAKRP